MESDYGEVIDQESGTFSNADDEEASLIEYARYYGLSKDYTAFYPLSPHILRSIPAWDHPDHDNNQLPQFKLPEKLELDEKWTIDIQSAIFLKQVASLDVAPFPEITRRRNTSIEYKVEPLLLSTDPELEQRRFIRARNSRLNKASQQVPAEALWQDDEAAPLYWPESDLPATLIEEIKKEKLQLDKNDILFLQQCISIPEEPEIQELDTPPHKKASHLCTSPRHVSNESRQDKSTRLQDIHHPSCHALLHSNSASRTRLLAGCHWRPVPLILFRLRLPGSRMPWTWTMISL